MSFKPGDRVAVRARDPNLSALNVAGRVDHVEGFYLFITLDDKRRIVVEQNECTLLLSSKQKPADRKS
jgi:hypothetical protein